MLLVAYIMVVAHEAMRSLQHDPNVTPIHATIEGACGSHRILVSYTNDWSVSGGGVVDRVVLDGRDAPAAARGINGKLGRRHVEGVSLLSCTRGAEPQFSVAIMANRIESDRTGQAAYIGAEVQPD